MFYQIKFLVIVCLYVVKATVVNVSPWLAVSQTPTAPTPTPLATPRRSVYASRATGQSTVSMLTAPTPAPLATPRRSVYVSQATGQSTVSQH